MTAASSQARPTDARLLRSDMPQSSWPVLISAMLLVIIPTMVISQITAHWRMDVVDDQMFGYYGWRILHGARVYLDVWDNKPPGIYWANALGMLIGGDSYAGVIAMVVLALVASHVCLFVTAASNYYRGAAALTTVLGSFYMMHGYYQGGTNRTETFLVACELAALALYMRGAARDRWWKWLLAGVFCGAAFLFKQTGLAAWGAMGLHTIILVLARDIAWRAGLRRCLLLAGGLGVTLALAAGALAWQGALAAAWYATFTFNRAYFQAGSSSFWETYLNYYLLKHGLAPVLKLPLLMALAAAVHAFLWWLRPRLRPREIERPLHALRPVCPRYMLLYGIWFGAALYGALVSPHHFYHYVLPTVPPLILIAGYLINVLRTEIGLVRRFQQRIWVLASFVAMAYFAGLAFRLHWESVSRVWVQRTMQERDAEWELVGDQVRRFTSADQTIQCWDYLPGVYLRARRVNACRYTTTEKLGQLRRVRWAVEPIESELRRVLDARPPALFVIGAGDYMWIHEPEHSQRPPGPLGRWLARWLDENYRLVKEVVQTNTFLFKRRDLPAAPAPAARRG